MAKAIMIQGTGSGAGKSLISAALCRIFSDEGMRVAPFKAQNMALNSYITLDGGEIGRAQALQAEAARAPATVDMNPILLKASGESGSQVIIHGKVHSTMKAKEYYAFKKTAWVAVRASFDRLSKQYDLIVMEGAGSPAEINLMDVDIVNMAAARYANAPVILVGDIDKGGVFASLYGTVELLKERVNPPTPHFDKGGMGGFCDADYIRGFIINKFRGDMDILKPGLDMIREKTGKPVIGVMPWINNVDLPEEDGLSLRGSNSKFKIQNSKSENIKIVIVRLQYISNFTDFDPFMYEPDVEIIYSRNPAEIENADMVIIPGSKNTAEDLRFLKETALDKSIKKAYTKGIRIIGICGGYQMLGRRIYDPHGIEGGCKEIEGLGLLNIKTTFETEKITCQVEAELTGIGDWGSGISKENTNAPNPILKGYEIHMGRSTGDIGLFNIKRLSSHPSPITHHPSLLFDGSRNRNCWGSYLHGIFENNAFRRNMLDHIRQKKGLEPLGHSIDYGRLRDEALDRLAGLVRRHVDMQFIKRMLEL
ncbi:MAG: cobyric acid synthase CobQ [Nitrospira bacterium HGW-Nitrospira-1]|nr:MAG: cobyric acid synthase CobQ [Nitrospira bacterium HGW-Nitrospira-1]